MPRTRVLFSVPEASCHMRSSAASTTVTSGFRFSVHKAANKRDMKNVLSDAFAGMDDALVSSALTGIDPKAKWFIVGVGERPGEYYGK
jgi:hypothetical protein